MAATLVTVRYNGLVYAGAPRMRIAPWEDEPRGDGNTPGMTLRLGGGPARRHASHGQQQIQNQKHTAGGRVARCKRW